MPYTTLGYNCVPQTVAVTSNHKFLPPLDYVYYKQITSMLMYPGQDVFTPHGTRGETSPKNIKAYYSKDSTPGPKSCPGCTKF